MSLDELLASLRADYIAQLPKKFEIIESQIAAAQLEDLRESFHKLKGTGKTYGIPEISTVAEVVEDICIQLPAQSTQAARQGLSLLREIYVVRQKGQELPIAQDSRLLSLRKLLPN